MDITGSTQKNRVLLLACGALAHEILTLIRQNGWDHIDLHCLPADLHLRPEKIPPAVEGAVREYREQYSQIFVVYADCGTGGLLGQACERLGVEMIAGPHCYAFFDGNEAFSARADEEMSTFYLTDFLVRQFEAFVWKPLGLDRFPHLRDMYFGHYTALVYLAQTDDAALDKKAQECAHRLGLTYQRRFTGYGDLQTILTQKANEGQGG